ncbi:MAG TPA: hypothetical protein VFI60_05730 [Candidatus Acidoferrum sp.]|nr:hypothetical protein [Candidatus Acidoferrum sp.]
MDIFSLVIEDLRNRDAIGYKQHRRPLTEDTRTLLQWLQESYEEQLDNAVYLRGAIEKLKGNLPPEEKQVLSYNMCSQGIQHNDWRDGFLHECPPTT